MDNEEIIEQQNAYYMAGYPSKRSEKKMNKDNLQLEQLMKELMMKKTCKRKKLELLGIIQSKDKIIADLEAQIEQLQKINTDQKETLKKVRVALIQERTANLMNYGKGGVEMFDNIFEIISKSISN